MRAKTTVVIVLIILMGASELRAICRQLTGKILGAILVSLWMS